MTYPIHIVKINNQSKTIWKSDSNRTIGTSIIRKQGEGRCKLIYHEWDIRVGKWGGNEVCK